jgi:hypothetical protein
MQEIGKRAMQETGQSYAGNVSIRCKDSTLEEKVSTKLLLKLHDRWVGKQILRLARASDTRTWVGDHEGFRVR